MKIKYGLILAVTLATGVTAQVAPNVPGSAPAPGATAPAGTAAKPAAKKKAHKLSADATKKIVRDESPREPFATNDIAVVKGTLVNIRGQANINSEIVTQLKEGDTVTVLGEVKLVHPKADEPSTWVRVSLPPDTHVWVNTNFVDTNHLVTSRKLNVRSGPGENYSVIGLLHKGDEVKPVGAKGDWEEITAPTNSYAFVAAHLLGKKGAAAPVVIPVAVETPTTAPAEPVVTPVVTPPTQPEPVPTTAVVDDKATIAPPPVTTPAVDTNTPAATPPPVEPKVAEPTPVVPAPAIPTPAVTAPVPVVPAPLAVTPPAKRIVTREGIVGDRVSIQAPSHFRLESLETGKSMDYLYSTNSSIVLRKYLGKTVLVTGEEGLDERWENTPVLTVQKIQPVE